MAEDIFAAQGKSADVVTTYQNEPASPRPTPIMEIAPDQGTFLRLLNRVAKGDEQGIPIFAKLKDSNGDPLPINTSLFLELQPAGMTEAMKVSEVVRSIDQYQTLSISEQRNRDNIDATKLTLMAPETADDGGAVPHVDVRDIDTAYLTAESSAKIDWSKSSVYIESNAVEKHGRR
ncbi:hypothetical protein VB773_01450 [Haloarculaceae archaeon H-GB2-1]|nr:hypothetical protein [Haloarculaceae archaeon H-GB1-1]MEA5406379.1 hypothetical protein [Haloarculaceae archaeon H-GB2-1]